MRCQKCGFGFTKGLVNKSGEYHRDETYIKEEELFKNIFSKRVNIIGRFLKTGKALEIGCSTGLLLSLLKQKDWDVKGVEISTKAAEIAKKRGLTIYTAPFEQLEINEKFDLVILNHTLEHLNDPYLILEKINKLLTPRGMLFLDLPNFGSLSVKIYGQNWPMLLPDEHRWHFNLESLSILFKSCGFKIEFVERASGIWDLANPAEGIWQSLLNFKKRFFVELITIIPSYLLTKLSMGTGLTVMAKKQI